MSSGKQIDLKAEFLSVVLERLSANPKCAFLGVDVSRHQVGAVSGRQVLDLPIAEESILGIALGMRRTGGEVYVDLMFEAFSARVMDVLRNQISLDRFLSPEQLGPMVVRMICGPISGAGSQHGSEGYAALSRINGILVASPCKMGEVKEACFVALESCIPMMLLFPPDIPTRSMTTVGSGTCQVRVGKGGCPMAVLALGLHASLVMDALERTDACGDVGFVSPLFLSPLPVDALAEQLAGVNRVVVVDGPGSPGTLGDLIATQLRARLPECEVSLLSLLTEGQGAAYRRERAVEEAIPLLLEALEIRR